MTARARGQWILLSLLVISVTINYIDRGTLSIAASRLSSELSLDPEKIGLLLSSFFWTYAAMQIVAGWLIDRYSVYWIFAGDFSSGRPRPRLPVWPGDSRPFSRCGLFSAWANRSRIPRIQKSSHKDLRSGIADSPTD